MSNKLRAIIFIFWMLPSLVSAQSSNTSEEEFIPSYLLQVSGTSFFENYNSFDIGILKDISPNRAIGIELGYIFDYYGFNNSNTIEPEWFNDVKGFKAYFQYRIYFNKQNEYLNNSRTFFDIEPSFYMMSYSSERIVGYQCNDEFGDCLYYRYFDSDINRLVPRLNLKIGKIYDFEFIRITIFGGMGINHIFENSDMPENPEPDKFFFKNGDMNDALSSGTNLNFRVGVQIGYRFN
jgi:hypothetical protein